MIAVFRLLCAALCGLVLLGCHTPGGPAARTADSPPNIVIIFVDDMGYGDAGCYGSKTIKTPNIDRLVKNGIRFTDFYVAQGVCSASRAALLTGCYPNRVGISGALGPGSKVGLSESETTLAEICRAKGYATAIFGKWHLGDAPKFMPTHHGFDVYWGLPYSNDMWPMHPDLMGKDAAERKKGYPPLPLLESNGNGGVRVIEPEVTPEIQATLTREITQHAVKFIEHHASVEHGASVKGGESGGGGGGGGSGGEGGPFFLYVAHSMPHVPLFGAPEFEGKSAYGKYGDIIEELDWSVGEIVDALKRMHADKNTLVIFTSDNGPWLSYGTHAGTTGGLREGKGTSWEGGVREPFVAAWPGHIPAGAVCHEPAMTIDLLPTVTKLIGGTMPAAKIDGLNIWPLLASERDTAGGTARSPHESLLFYYNQNDLEAIRSGKWKLVFPHTYRSLVGAPGKDGKPAGYEQRTCSLELYNLEADPGEKANVAGDHPEVVARLQTLAEKARDDLGDGLTKQEGKGRRDPGKL